ncbi:hypothetical protein BJY52DRAFT_1378744 [Lactarius psammicola]|nr:hypothetical protein BJY52DRAFT_1378744 [Lactarius psammicola]
MNPPPQVSWDYFALLFFRLAFTDSDQSTQIGSRVRWWNSKGQLMHGVVRTINVLSDNSHVVVIQVEAGAPSTVSLPLDHLSVWITCLRAQKNDVTACKMGLRLEEAFRRVECGGGQKAGLELSLQSERSGGRFGVATNSGIAGRKGASFVTQLCGYGYFWCPTGMVCTRGTTQCRTATMRKIHMAAELGIDVNLIASVETR